MNVLVTGATGFLGQNVVRALLAHGDAVRVLARSRAKASPLVDLGAELAIGDVADVQSLDQAIRKAEVVYHLAGRLFEPGVPNSEYMRTHVIGTHLLMACCRDRLDLRRFVHVSTTGVLGATGSAPLDESRPAAPTNAYERTKWLAEKLVRREIARGFPAVIARPGLVYGPGDLHLLGFFRAIQRRLFRPIGTQPVWLHPIYVDDLTEALLLCGEHPNAVGNCFHLAGQRPVTLVSLARTIASAQGTTLPDGRIPPFVAHALATAGDMLPAPLRRHAPLTRSRLDFLTNSRVYDVSRARRLLDFVANTDLSEGIAQTVAWYRQNGYLSTPMNGADATPRPVGSRQ